MLDPPLKSIPVFKPPLVIKKNIPGVITRNEIIKKYILLSANFIYLPSYDFNFFEISPPPDGIKRLIFLDIGLSANNLISVLLTNIAEIILIDTPIANVAANPWTIVAPNCSENQ
tara:strand:+ start:2055 stop:2399 length:345 start_codon:yes stop_codon:yes gene_type:complete